jgi:hypothetical protein
MTGCSGDSTHGASALAGRLRSQFPTPRVTISTLEFPPHVTVPTLTKRHARETRERPVSYDSARNRLGSNSPWPSSTG